MDKQTEKKVEQPASNIVSLFGSKKSAAADDENTAPANENSQESFLEAIKRNFENQERMKKERLKANQSVLKSYRIKN